ncbi:hypothetical protein [Methylocystis parvus]|nr:hypothetical protein [Methylocystis parvus]
MFSQAPDFAFFLAPFALLWLAFAVVETREVLAAIRAGRGC